MLLAVALIYIPLALLIGRLMPNLIMSIIMKLVLIAGGVGGVLIALGIIPTKAKKSIPAAIVFALTTVYLLAMLISSVIGSGILAGNTDNDGHKRGDPYTIEGNGYDRTYHPCLEEGDEVWFEYEATATAQKRIYLQNIDGDYTITVYKGRSKSPIATGSNGEALVDLEEGKKYIILVEINTPDPDTTWSILVGNPIPMGATSDKAYTVTEGYNDAVNYDSLTSGEYSEVWFKFTPEQSARYTFAVSDCYSEYSLYLYTDPSYSYEYSTYSCELECLLTGGTTYYYKVSMSTYYSSYDTSFAVDISREPMGTSADSAYELTEDGMANTEFQSLDNNTHVWFKFVPTSDAYYTFSPASGVYDYDYSVYNEYQSSQSSNGGYYYLYEGYVYYIQVYDVYEDSFSIAVDTPDGTSFDNAMELTLGTTLSVNGISDVHEDYVYFQFTPADNGWYKFSTDYDYDHYLYFYSEDDTGSDLTYVYNNDITYELTADTTYYIKLYNSNSYWNCDYFFNMTVESVAGGESRESAYEIILGENEAQEYESLIDGDYVWFKFAPSESAYYQIDLTGVTDTYSIYVYQEGYTSYLSASDVYYYLSSGYTYYIQCYNSADDSFGVDLTQAKGDYMSNAIELEEGKETSTGYSSYVHSSGNMYFEFTPETSGKYKFSVTDMDYSYYLYIYEHDYSYSYEVNVYNDYLTYDLSAGNTYYIRLYMDSSYDSSFNMYAGAVYDGSTRETAYELLFGENEGQSYASFTNGNSVWFSFSPDTTGCYDFVIDSGAQTYTAGSIAQTYTLSVVDEYGSTASYYDGYGYYMSSGYTYYVLCTADGEYDSYNFGVNVAKSATGTARDDAYELTCDEVLETGYNSNFNSYGEIWYEFTPDEAGYYNLYISNANTRYVYIYEGYNTSYSNRSDQSSTYSYMKQYMYAGTTYYIYIDFTSSYDYDFDMAITRTATGSSDSDAIDLYTDFYLAAGYNSSYNLNGEVWFDFTPETDGYYQFTVADAMRRYFYIYDSDLNIVYNMGGYTTSSSNYAVVNLTAGSKYYVLVDFTSSSYYDSSFYMNVQKLYYGYSTGDAIEIGSSSIYTGYNSTYNTDNEMWFSFTTGEADEYVLYLSSISRDYDLYVYSDTEASNLVLSATGNYGSNYFYVNCEADTTYYVKVYFTSSVDTGFYIQAYQN